MGMFDWMSDDEEEKTTTEPVGPQAGPPVAAAAPQVQAEHQKKLLRDRLMDRYTRASDDRDVKEAQARADRNELIAGLGKGITQVLTASSAARTGKATDTSTFDQIGANAHKHVERAEAARQRRMDDVLGEDKLEQIGTARERSDTEWKWKADANDPNSVVARQARNIIAKQSGVSPQHLEGMTFAQMKELGLKAKEAKQKGYQFKAVEKDGKIEWYAADPDTGRMVPTGNQTGFKFGTDSVTGSRISGSDSTAPAVPIMNEDGLPLAQVRTGLEGQRSHARGTGTQQAKNEQAVKESDAKAADTDVFLDNMTNLHAGAEKEGPFGNTGPVMGRIAEKGADLGFDMGENTNRAAVEMRRQMAQYLKEVTGLASTDAEFERHMTSAPGLSKDPAVFRANMKAWAEEVRRDTAKKRQIAGQTSSRTQSSETAPPAAKEVRRRTKPTAEHPQGRTAVFDADTKQFLRYE